MADITDAVFQSEVADSLLNAPLVATFPHEGNYLQAEEGQSDADAGDSQFTDAGAMIQEQIEEDDPKGVGMAAVLKYGDAEVERRIAERGEQEPLNQRQAQEQFERLVYRGKDEQPEIDQKAAQQEQHAPTPEEVQQGVEKLDNAVKEYGLNEPADARQFADEFCGAFGTDPFKAGIDVESLGGVMSKTALSALQIFEATGGDLSKMGDIPAQNAQAFAHDLLKGMGIDPRSMNVDAMLLARTTLGGMVNFVNTVNSYGGRVTDLAKLNDPQQAEFYLQNFLKALGIEGPVNREAALRFADACGKQMLRVMGKLSQVQSQSNAAPQKQQRARGQRIPAQFRDGIKGSRVPKFKSNADIFSGSAVEAAMSQKL